MYTFTYILNIIYLCIYLFLSLSLSRSVPTVRLMEVISRLQERIEVEMSRSRERCLEKITNLIEENRCPYILFSTFLIDDQNNFLILSLKNVCWMQRSNRSDYQRIVAANIWCSSWKWIAALLTIYLTNIFRIMRETPEIRKVDTTCRGFSEKSESSLSKAHFNWIKRRGFMFCDSRCGTRTVQVGHGGFSDY